MNNECSTCGESIAVCTARQQESLERYVRIRGLIDSLPDRHDVQEQLREDLHLWRELVLPECDPLATC